MVEDIFAQLAAIRQSLEAELKNDSDTSAHKENAVDQTPTIEPTDIQTEEGLTKRNAPCPCGSGKRFKHCHGQHGPSLEMEDAPIPRQITFDTAVEISSVKIGGVELLSADAEPGPQISSLGVSDQHDANEAELAYLQVERVLREDPAWPFKERDSFSTQGTALQQAPAVALSEGNESRAIEMIVAGHVKLKNRRALADLLAHRHKVLGELQAVSGISPASVVRIVLEEIALIEAGLAELRPPPGKLPENEWT